MNISVAKIVKIMSEMAPARLAEDWDNVGLQVGHNEKEVKIILCALDFSAEVLEQAVQVHADIIITHHPAIFRGIKQLTDLDWRTALLLEAARHDIAVYSRPLLVNRQRAADANDQRLVLQGLIRHDGCYLKQFCTGLCTGLVVQFIRCGS